MMKISFVIPVYNRKDHIINTLEALGHQRDCYKGCYEVILVDDGSCDDLYSSIREIDRNYELKYFYLRRCDESCISRARNHGWRNAAGDVIVFIDSDIIVNENYLEEVNRYYNAEENLLLIGTRLMLDDEVTRESVRDRSVFKKYSSASGNSKILENRYSLFDTYSYNAAALKYPWLKAYGCNFIIPKAWLEKAGGFDESMRGWGAEDIELACRCYEAGIKVFVNSKLEVLHQFHGGSDIIGEDKFAAYEKNIQYFIDRHPCAIDKPRELIDEIFKGREDIDFNLYHEKLPTLELVEFRDRERLPELKETLLCLSNEKNKEIIVNDYVEDTDLDIWIQLLGRRSSTPKYYPFSKRLGRGNIK
ncbi:GT2 family glycosyltransferase [Anaerobacterium chartisolvens]|uniref:GT2 family glycosyltransferase n=1 Tax=Anaerobacterium chartisolvens TaxID=1297424 RepID=A0A369BHN5_9FIRM|nr:glycosyltransferase [Anaerobacterium chartisolvens]RCX20076.1 GT2 family glycosyltransferase [Anaerobacterium chartisolvens]